MADYSQGAFFGEASTLSDNLQQAVSRLRTGIDEATNYAPGTPGDWSGTAPTTIAEAIDRIAKVVATEHGAIS